MTKRLKRTGTVALGIGLITKGARMLENGLELQGTALVAAGILVVYGYHVIEDMGIEEVTNDILENLKVVEETTDPEESK